MSTAFPPQVRLVRVVTALTADVSTRWSTVLADPRWAEVATSIDRLSVPGVAAGLARELGDEESERLTALLLERWAAVGEVSLPPAAAIVGPSVGPTAPGGAGPGQPGLPELSVVVDGLDDGWTATWQGPVEPADESGAVVRLVADTSTEVHLNVRVFGRTPQGRTILTAETVVPDPAVDLPGFDPADSDATD